MYFSRPIIQPFEHISKLVSRLLLNFRFLFIFSPCKIVSFHLLDALYKKDKDFILRFFAAFRYVDIHIQHASKFSNDNQLEEISMMNSLQN